jgi:predicted RNA-binding protein (virulence factor B family)
MYTKHKSLWYLNMYLPSIIPFVADIMVQPLEKLVFQYLRIFIELIIRLQALQILVVQSKRLIMIQLGKINQLEVLKEVDFGMYLDAGEGVDEILLPQKYIPEKTQVGDTLSVFIYRDSEDRLIATTQQPLACVGELAYLKVVDTNQFGVFLDWGLLKDLFVPFSEQNKKMVKGNYYVVKVIIDEQTDRIIASARIERFLKHIPEGLEENQAVDILPFEYTDLGVKVIINGDFLGVLYHNEVFKPVPLGEPLKGYVKKLRPDHKVDVSLTKSGYEEVLDSKVELWKKLQEYKGYLPLTDKSEPEAIYALVHMSKKNFKKAVGGLFKERKITLADDGIYLTTEE